MSTPGFGLVPCRRKIASTFCQCSIDRLACCLMTVRNSTEPVDAATLGSLSAI